MKTQVCYSQDDRLIQALRLYKSALNPKSSASSHVDKAVVLFLETNIQRIQSDNVRTEIVELVESYKDAEG